MAMQMRLTSYQVADLAVVRDLGGERLDEIARCLEQLDPKPLRTRDLAEIIAARIGDEGAAESLVRQLVSLYGLVRQRGIAVDDLLDAVTAALRQPDAGWNPFEQDRWQEIRPAFERLFGTREVRNVATALELSYEYANLLQGARILTDVRPIFDEPAHRVEGAVVGHTLRIRYDSVDGSHSLSIALDNADVKALKEQCERALRKARLARTFGEQAQVTTIISGESDDEPAPAD